MFFMMGIMDRRKELEYNHLVICDKCGAYGRMQVFMTCTVLSLFFIPCFRWNKHYYVQMSCCNTVYEIPKEIGVRIAAGEDVEVSKDDLMLVKGFNVNKICRSCGYVTNEDFEYCPKCGTRF